jgi:transcriptional regulator with XRE-family HTH domain
MKIIANNLKSYVSRAGLTAQEVADRTNAIQNSLGFVLTPVTKESIYNYYRGVTPPLKRMYIISAILDVPTRKLWVLDFDPCMERIVREEIKNLFPKK